LLFEWLAQHSLTFFCFAVRPGIGISFISFWTLVNHQRPTDSLAVSALLPGG
jgi:hypothetical protein